MKIPFGEIGPPYWDDQPLYIVGGGPSLAGHDLSGLPGRVLAVNRAAFVVPCDAMVTLDQTFVNRYRDDIVRHVSEGKEAFIALAPNDAHQVIPGATYLVRARAPGLPRTPDRTHGVNSGYAALCVALHKRAKEVALLGFDMQYDRAGNTHFHGGYAWHNRSAGKWMHRWGGDFQQAATQLKDAGVSVTNFVGPQGSKVVGIAQRPLGDVI